MENKKMITDGVHLHINNGGVSFSVTETDFLAIEVEASHFGNITNHIKLYVNPQSLERLGKMMIEASEREAKVAEYLSLESFLLDKDTGKTKDGSNGPYEEAAAGTTASGEESKQHFVSSENKFTNQLKSDLSNANVLKAPDDSVEERFW